ncbi:hypothetical protein Y032_0003g1652 [Ancylostoma ceylanicum]|uniref:Uncharacterized protein n=1 Tax=Ancylostoma ceylanicum TaxID=53326 RepID=A0A016VZ37_9BILA|nr:hypothetical protein Y032_0003g1652 [Ancylostoma ceylanicum]
MGSSIFSGHSAVRLPLISLSCRGSRKKNKLDKESDLKLHLNLSPVVLNLSLMSHGPESRLIGNQVEKEAQVDLKCVG